jgi:hypothetical protein
VAEEGLGEEADGGRGGHGGERRERERAVAGQEFAQGGADARGRGDGQQIAHDITHVSTASR